LAKNKGFEQKDNNSVLTHTDYQATTAFHKSHEYTFLSTEGSKRRNLSKWAISIFLIIQLFMNGELWTFYEK